MLGIIIAMPSEARCFCSSFRQIGKIYPFGANAWVAVSGVGDAVRNVIDALCRKGVSCLISCGSAVGLAADLKPGNICIPSLIFNSSGEKYHCNLFLRNYVLSCLKQQSLIIEGPLIHTPSVLQTTLEKQHLHQKTGAVVADMESFLIGREAMRVDLPILALRVIVDTADFNMPDQFTHYVSKQGEVMSKKILLSLVKRPKLLFPLGTLARNFIQTRQSLKQISQQLLSYWYPPS